MKDKNFYSRMATSARDFVTGVQPFLENEMGIKVHPIEEVDSSELMKNLDQHGIDAFYYDKEGDIRGLASRMNYSSHASTKPAFTFRYKLWDQEKNCWDDNREYARKLRAANSSEEFILFPRLHIESFSKEKGSGWIGWSFAANTKDLMNFINANLDNPDLVQIFTPKLGERRQVISVPVDKFSLTHVVTEIFCNKPVTSCRKPPPRRKS